MYRCSCTIPRKSSILGKNVYLKHSNKMPQNGWYFKTSHPNYLTYKINGSYASRNRRIHC